jgi:hypothetical protein
LIRLARQYLKIAALLLLAIAPARAADTPRQTIIDAILSSDNGRKRELIATLMGKADESIGDLLIAWRKDELFVHTAADGTKTPVHLIGTKDSNGAQEALRVADDQPFTGSVVLTNDVPSLKSTWTVNVTNGFRWQEYRIDEVLAYRYATQVDLSWECKPGRGFSILAEALNITGRARTRSSASFAELRNNSPVLLNEQFAVHFPASFFVRVRKTW